MKSSRWTEIAAVALLVASIGFVYYHANRNEPGIQPIRVGAPLPALEVEGWLNGEPTSADVDSGELLVVDCWASWCGPCRAEMPTLARLVRRYRPQGVAFIGLTPENEDKVENVKDFIGRVNGFDWPVGYGASGPMDALGVPGFPTLIVFDADRKVAWSGHSTHGLEAALDRMLAAR